jgi:exosortase D (VPLPA-CTERM-specific)
MSDTSGASDPSAQGTRKLPSVVLLAVAIAALVYAFRDSLAWAAVSWTSDEYNHCYLIPFIALFMIATWGRELAALPWAGSSAGVPLILGGLLLLLLGNLSSVYTISQYGFLVAVWGAFLAVLGGAVVRRIWPALLYLAFMMPLPDFIEVKLTADMQLISSRLGVAVIRLAGLPVYLEGNVIDLGQYQLAVAEACSGLRYLFPLMSFGFLCAVIYKAPLWQRAVVFLVTVPITILMNSFRIGVIGILVNTWGTEQAAGFLHDFEGWVVFMACVSILFALMFVMARASGRHFLKSLRLDTPPVRDLLAMMGSRPAHRVAVAGTLAALLVVGVGAQLGGRQESIPQRATLSTFPLVVAEWRGREDPVERQFLDVLKADDTFLGTYARQSDTVPTMLWIAYYGSQREGRAVHSPKTCLPGGGWEVQSFEERMIEGIRFDDQPQPVNRVVIGQGQDRQLVYYWFDQRGRVLTNEYLVKWYIFLDGLRLNRTDGALVRLVTPVEPTDTDLTSADRRLQDFIRTIHPKLAYFLPQREAVLMQARAH